MIHINLDKKREKNKIRALSPIAFEEYMANLFRECGYEVIQTPPTNDGGKDLILQYDGKKYYVECKHFTEGAVGREIIQKLVGAGIVDGDVDGFVVATTSYYNDNAIACMEKSNVPLFLLDLDDIVSIYVTSKNEKSDLFITNEGRKYINSQITISNKERFKVDFGNLLDYKQSIASVYYVNTYTMHEVKFGSINAIECSYCFEKSKNQKEYRKVIFTYGDEYFLLHEAIFDNYKDEIIYQTIHDVPLRRSMRNDFRMRQLKNFAYALVNKIW